MAGLAQPRLPQDRLQLDALTCPRHPPSLCRSAGCFAALRLQSVHQRQKLATDTVIKRHGRRQNTVLPTPALSAFCSLQTTGNSTYVGIELAVGGRDCSKVVLNAHPAALALGIPQATPQILVAACAGGGLEG